MSHCMLQRWRPGISDQEILQRANAQMSMLVTADKDFGEMIFRQGQLNAAAESFCSVLPDSQQRRKRILSVAFFMTARQHYSRRSV